MDLEEELYEDSTEEQPVVLEDPKTQVYLPVATTQTKGIASFDAKDFNVDPSGKVALNEDLHQIKENTDTALENSQEAKETADSAKETAEEALSTGNTALNIANSIDGKATEALSTANEALEQVVESLGTGIYVNGVLQKSVNVKSDIQEQFDQLTEEVEDVKELVPNQASAQNQLADKNFVNSSINAIAAFYITYDSQGNPFPTKAALSSATTFYSGGETRVPTRNDYCLVLADETHDNASCRYVYSGEYPNGQWDFQFIVNESPFTSDQVAAINSGITSNLVQQIPNKADLNNPNQNIIANNVVASGENVLTPSSLLNLVYPIGSIYMSVNNVSPEGFLGGEWDPWGAGRVPVGVGNNGETNYTAAEQEGGSENSVAVHSHSTQNAATYWDLQIRDFWGDQNRLIPYTGANISYGQYSGGNNRYAIEDSSTQKNASTLSYYQEHGHGINATGTQGGNRQPYITCYMWKRTA